MTEDHKRSPLAAVIALSDDDYEVVINRGSRDGLEIGSRYLVYGLGPKMQDPETGEDLGELEIVRGRGQVTHIQEKIATVRCIETTRKRTSTRRIIKEEQPIYHFGPKRTIEETSPVEEVSEPFKNPTRGDKAKPI